jgi:hypothetical protein
MSATVGLMWRKPLREWRRQCISGSRCRRFFICFICFVSSFFSVPLDRRNIVVIVVVVVVVTVVVPSVRDRVSPHHLLNVGTATTSYGYVGMKVTAKKTQVSNLNAQDICFVLQLPIPSCDSRDPNAPESKTHIKQAKKQKKEKSVNRTNRTHIHTIEININGALWRSAHSSHKQESNQTHFAQIKNPKRKEKKGKKKN